MRIGIESAAYVKQYGLEEGLARMKRHGYDSLDDAELAETEAELFRCPEDEFERRLIHTAQAAKDSGIEIFQTHGPWRWPPRDGTPEDRAERFEKMEKSLRGTRLLGAKYMVIHPIMPFGTEEQPDEDLFWSLNFDFFRRLTRAAEREGVIICFENMPMPLFPLARPLEILDFVRKIDSPAMRVCLDTGHCAVCGVSPAEAVRLLGREYLRVLHVHDNDGRADLHLLPGAGVIDWPDFAASLQEIGYDGVLSLETNVGHRLTECLSPAERERREQDLAAIACRLAGR